MSSYTVVEQQQQQQPRTVRLRDSSQRMARLVSPEGVRSEPSFWSILAQKAKSVLVEDDSLAVNDSSLAARTRSEPPKDENPSKEQPALLRQTTPPGKQGNMGRPIQKGLDAIASSLSLIGDTLGSAIEEGFHLIDGKPSTVKTASPEVSKSLQRNSSIWKKVEDVQARQTAVNTEDSTPANVQLKASRDVAMAMASKAKGLLRELKTVKAEQTFLKNRCAQLEEENRQLREGAYQGDDFVRQQLESLLAEKQRLAQENASLRRENQLLHEVVEYHHLTLQDVALLDDRLAEETEDFSSDSNDSLFPHRHSFHES
ncbi:unnamed protein product [Calypogeia fissa]